MSSAAMAVNDISMRVALNKYLWELGQRFSDLCYLAPDGSISNEFEHHFKNRFFDVGIAEQNLINIACGLALSKKRVVVSSIASFLVANAYLQIRNSLCYPNLNVTIIGVGAGLSYGALGATHHCNEDIALMRILPNMKVFLPCDATEVKYALETAVEINSPCYIRLLNHNLSSSLLPSSFEQIKLTKEGERILVVSMGLTFIHLKKIIDNYERNNIHLGLLNINSINLIDTIKLKNELKKYKIIISVEEHFISGGIGSYLSEIITKFNLKLKLYAFGVKNEFCSIAGSYVELMKFYGLDDDTLNVNINKIVEEHYL
jgi:transketolase